MTEALSLDHLQLLLCNNSPRGAIWRHDTTYLTHNGDRPA